MFCRLLNDGQKDTPAADDDTQKIKAAWKRFVQPRLPFTGLIAMMRPLR
jgi:hypothetical protein